MKKTTLIPKIIIIVGVCLALAGFAAGGLKGFWVDRHGVHLASTERGNLVKVDENYTSFESIELNADYIARITIEEGNGYAVRGQNYERYGGLSVRVSGDKLIIDATREGRWFNIGIDELFGWTESDSWLEITFPKGAKLSLVSTNVSAGRVYINGLECEKLNIDNSFGKIDASYVTCDTLNVNASSGDTKFSNINIAGKAVIDNDFGNTSLEYINAENLLVKLDSGDLRADNITASTLEMGNHFGEIDLNGAVSDSVTLKLSAGDLSAGNVETKDLSVESDFGTVRIDRLILSGHGKIDQSSGDVHVSLDMSEDELSYELDTSAGSVSIDGRKSGNSVYNRNTGADVSLRIGSSFGSINVKFLK